MNAYVLFRGGKALLPVVLGEAFARRTPSVAGSPSRSPSAVHRPPLGPCVMEVKQSR
jgi:hypothetical protein